jgi:hypothetical protein
LVSVAQKRQQLCPPRLRVIPAIRKTLQSRTRSFSFTPCFWK